MALAFERYLAALEQRHLANLTRPELTRALRALSSCYVERRGTLASGAPLGTAGKRAAFALYYGPLHFLTIAEIVRALGTGALEAPHLLDLGCGTGVGGAAWALALESQPRIEGIDRSAWAIQEANWTYRQFELRGHAGRGELLRGRVVNPGTAILLAYTVNELEAGRRSRLLERIEGAVRGRTPVLVVEPIARRGRDWWSEWADRLAPFGARVEEWRLTSPIPGSLRDLARAAGLNPTALTARSISANLS